MKNHYALVNLFFLVLLSSCGAQGHKLNVDQEDNREGLGENPGQENDKISVGDHTDDGRKESFDTHGEGDRPTTTTRNGADEDTFLKKFDQKREAGTPEIDSIIYAYLYMKAHYKWKKDKELEEPENVAEKGLGEDKDKYPQGYWDNYKEGYNQGMAKLMGDELAVKYAKYYALTRSKESKDYAVSYADTRIRGKSHEYATHFAQAKKEGKSFDWAEVYASAMTKYMHERSYPFPKARRHATRMANIYIEKVKRGMPSKEAKKQAYHMADKNRENDINRKDSISEEEYREENQREGDWKKRKQGDTDLIRATRAENPTWVRNVLQENANCTIKDEEGKTALMIAAEHGNLVIVDEILQEKAGVTSRNIRDNKGNTALTLARKGLKDLKKRKPKRRNYESGEGYEREFKKYEKDKREYREVIEHLQEVGTKENGWRRWKQRITPGNAKVGILLRTAVLIGAVA